MSSSQPDSADLDDRKGLEEELEKLRKELKQREEESKQREEESKRREEESKQRQEWTSFVFKWTFRAEQLKHLLDIVASNPNSRPSFSTTQSHSQRNSIPNSSPASKRAKTVKDVWGQWEIGEDEVPDSTFLRELDGRWVNLLGEKLSPRPMIASRQNPSRLKQGPVSSEGQSAQQLEFEESAQTIEENSESSSSVYQQAGERKTSMGKEMKDKTVSEALNFLNSDHKISEKRHTQWVVNRILQAALPTLQSVAGKHKEYFSPLKSLQDKIELHFYAETHHSRKATRRLPDSAFYLGGQGSSIEFSADVAQKGMLISFEHKTNLGNPALEREGQQESCRDFVEKIGGSLDLCAPPVGYSVLTDGIRWRFFRFQLVANREEGKSEKTIQISSVASEIISTLDEKSKNGFRFDRLAKWLCFVLERSFKEQTRGPVDLHWDAKDSQIKLSTETTFHTSKLLQSGRFLVLKGKYTNCSDAVVLKIPLPAYELEKGEGKLKKEKNILAVFRDCQCIAKMDPTADKFYLSKNFLAIKDAGLPLDKLVISGNVGKELAKIVKRDIFGNALSSFKELKYAHTDLHPGNICIKELCSGMQGTVVDLESAVKWGDLLKESPIKYRGELGIETGMKASFIFDTAMVLATLFCLYEEGSFHNLVQKRNDFYLELEKDGNWEPQGLLEKIDSDFSHSCQ